MKQLIVVRRLSDASLVCFGPNNGMYEPSFDPLTMTQHLEPEGSVMAEWTRTHPAPVDKKLALLANPLVPQWFKDYLS